MPKVEVSFGELIDKITILDIKLSRIKDKDKCDIIMQEVCPLYDELSALVWENLSIDDHTKNALHNFVEDLHHINNTLWDIEDTIRLCHATEESDDKNHIIRLLSWLVINNNKKRAEIKKQINETLGSDIEEIKDYK